MTSVTLARYGQTTSPRPRCAAGAEDRPCGLAKLAAGKGGASWPTTPSTPTTPRSRPAVDPTSGHADSPADAASDSPTAGGGRRSRAPRRRAHDPRGAAAAEVDAVLAKRHRVVAVRLTELEHLGWRRAAASDKRGQVGAWVRSVVAAELTRRQGADVPPDDGDAEAGAGVRVVLNDSVVRELAQQLVRVGSNMNQVTRFGAHRGPRPRHGCGGDGADGGGDRSDAGHDRRAGFSA